MTPDCSTAMGNGPLMVVVCQAERKLSQDFTTSCFPPPSSLLPHLPTLDCNTAVGIGPLMVVVRQTDRKLSWDITIFSSPTPSSFVSRLQRLSGLDPWHRSSVRAKYDHHLSTNFYYDQFGAGHLGLCSCSQKQLKEFDLTNFFFPSHISNI